MTRSRVGWLLWLAVCGCSDGHSGSAAVVPARGTADCHAWQDAYCDAAADRCALMDRASCDDDARAITCASDQHARDCVTLLRDAPCSMPPLGCSMGEIADPMPAMMACVEFQSRTCEREQSCTGVVVTDCLDTLSSQMDCSRAIGVTVAFDQCLAEVRDVPCSIARLPASCSDGIKALP
jgi:hypothetical protein